jgi:hypothetical protein
MDGPYWYHRCDGFDWPYGLYRIHGLDGADRSYGVYWVDRPYR